MSEEVEPTVKFTIPSGKLKTGSQYRVKQVHGIAIDTCQHKTAVVDANARTVICERCGVALDPIQVLVKIAYEDRKLDERVELIRKDNERAQAAAEHRKTVDNERARKKLSELPIGTPVYVNAGHGGCAGFFAGIDDDKVVLKWSDKRVAATYALDEVTGVRRAKIDEPNPFTNQP